MHFNQVVDLLKEENIPLINLKLNENLDILDLDLLIHDSIGDFDRTVFMSNDQDFNVDPSIESLISSYPINKETYDNLKNYIEIPPEYFGKVYNILKKELTRSLKIQNIYFDLIKQALNGHTINQLLHDVDFQIEESIVAIDLSGKVLGHSKNFKVNDPLWMSSLEKGYLPIEFMAHIESKKGENTSINDPTPYTSFCQLTSTKYFCSKIFLKRQHLGYIFMFSQDNTFSKDSKYLLPIISEVSSSVFIMEKGSSDIYSSLEKNLLADLLTGIDESHAKSRIKSLNMKFPDMMTLIIFKPNYFLERTFLDEKIYNKILKLYQNPLYLIKENSLMILIDANKDVSFYKKLVAKTRPILEEYKINMGISNPFLEPTDLPIYYRQAQKALMISNKKKENKNVVFYSHNAFDDLLENVSKTSKIETFCHPYLKKLEVYDKKNNTELFKTLEVYVKTGYNKKETANILGIHRNTLNYRRDQINEYLSSSLEDENILEDLLYSFKIHSFLRNNYL